MHDVVCRRHCHYPCWWCAVVVINRPVGVCGLSLLSFTLRHHMGVVIHVGMDDVLSCVSGTFIHSRWHVSGVSSSSPFPMLTHGVSVYCYRHCRHHVGTFGVYLCMPVCVCVVGVGVSLPLPLPLPLPMFDALVMCMRVIGFAIIDIGLCVSSLPSPTLASVISLLSLPAPGYG